MRDHYWHRRDFSATLASIRDLPSGASDAPQGRIESDWGPATRGLVRTGSCALLDVHYSIEEQAEWLSRQGASYLLTHPSIVAELARWFIAQERRLLGLQEVRTFGEVVEPELRTLVREAWDVPLVDAYSAGEVGYIALQCPDCEQYHVQAEAVMVEVLDDNGNACQPGEVGRVVITSLTNLAMPLLRYEIGDYAEVGDPCPCGRGLPVLRRVLGRKRNTCILPDGSRRWPSLSADELSADLSSFPPIQQFQLIQRSRQSIELLLVAPRHLALDEEQRVQQWVATACGYPFGVEIRYVDSVGRSPSGKFEDFVCLVDSVTTSDGSIELAEPTSATAS